MTIGKYVSEPYTPQEEQRLLEFRTKVGDLELSKELLEDAQLIRWLRARNLDLDKSYDMLKKSLEWRKEHRVDGILEREDVPDDIKRRTPFADCGLDKDGYPIIIVPMGRQDGRSMLEQYGAEACLRFNTINCEKVTRLLRQLSEEQGREVTQLVEIIDLEGYNYRQLTSKLCRDFLVKMQTTFDANYPEMLRYCLVVNAPKIFHILFSILKPFIPKQTLEKVDIYGPEPEKWRKVVAERFPLEQIPPHWGGTKPGGDEFCSKSEIWVQGPVPVSYFQDGSLSTSPSSEDPSLIPATVNARDQLRIQLPVTKKNSSIAWRFRSQSHDIGFEILFEDGTSVLPHRRAQSHKEVQEGTLPCEEIGNYTVIFDNSYSLTRSKTLWYTVAIIEPEAVNCNFESAPLSPCQTPQSQPCIITATS